MIKKISDKLKKAFWMLTDTKHEILTSPQMIDVVSVVNSKHMKLMSDIQLANILPCESYQMAKLLGENPSEDIAPYFF